jgi:EpsI family protein
MANPRPLNLLKSTPFVVLILALIAQGVALRAVSRPESVSPPPPLSSFPQRIGPWQLGQEGYVDSETRSVLQADDLLARTYVRPGDRLPVNLFIANFLSQRNGKAPHSPKNCLPGAGWVQQTAEILKIDAGQGRQIEVNHYIVANRDSRSDVMYWYQSRDRVVASEYKAKLFVMADSIRYNRTDTALIRVITPIADGQDEPSKTDNIEFIRVMFPMIRGFLPS